MVLDTSAVIAILLKEPQAEQFLSLLYEAESVAIAAPTMLECEIVVMTLLGAEGQMRLYDFLRALGAQIVPFGETELAVAGSAYREYGEGRHTAGLNFGDCFSYALAIVREEPLLFKGNDFSKTDVTAAN